MLELDKDSKSDKYEIKLLETFSLNIPSLKHDCMKSEIEIKSNVNKGWSICEYLLPSLCSNLHQPSDEHCDHTYSITSSHSYRQRQHIALNKCPISCCQQAKTNPPIIKTGELTMKILNNISDTSVPKNLLEREKIQSKVGKRSSKHKDEKFLILSSNNYINTRSRKKPCIIHVIQPTDFCVHCHKELYPISMKSSVFCLKTGNVLITCWNCSTKMSVKGAFKLPKFLYACQK